MSKELNFDSTRQKMIEVMYEARKPLKGSEIKAGLVAKGVDKKIATRVHSYLVSFRSMATPKVIKTDDGYELSRAAIEQYEATRGLRETEDETDLVAV